MKRLGKGLYERIISMDNLWSADANAQRRKKGRRDVIEHNKHRAEDLQALHEMLAAKAYVPSPYRTFTIHEPKEREIASLPYFPDRIIHHAILNVLEGVWRRSLTTNTYACLKGRGIEGCRRKVRQILDGYVRRGERCYCLKIDIKQFYPSVRPDMLKRVIRRRIKCEDTLALLDTIIDSAAGLPIGNYVSQYFANLYLSPFMHACDDGHITCVEYMDDIVFFSDDKQWLHGKFRDFVVGRVEGLGLQLKEDWQVFPIASSKGSNDGRALDYVGYTFYMGHTGLRKRIKRKFARRAAALHHKGVTGKRLRMKLSPWTGWAKHADCKHLVKRILKSA